MKTILFSLAMLCFLLPVTGLAQPSALKIFGMLPQEAFTDLPESISQQEQQKLARSGESNEWKINFKARDRITLLYKPGRADVNLWLFSAYKNVYPACLQSSYGQSVQLRCWLYHAGSNKLSAVRLPKIHANQFLGKDQQLEANYPLYAYFHIDKDSHRRSSIKAELFTWMNKDFATREIKYSIRLQWKNNSLVLNKKPAR